MGAAALAISSSGLLSGCSGSPDLMTADVARRPVTDLDASTQRMLNAFTATLLGRQDLSGNVISSPFSVAVVMAMVRNGAAGHTAAQMDAALGFGELDELNAGINTVLQTLESRSGERTRTNGKKGEVSLSLAQQVWGHTSITWEEGFLGELAQWYGAGVAPIDFTQSEQARTTINTWVADHTEDKITDIVPAGAITVDTRLALANALYLKAAWDDDFARLGPRPFRTKTGKVGAEMMFRSAELPVHRGTGWTAVSVPYIGSELGMALFQSGAGAESEMMAGLADGDLFKALNGLTPEPVNLTMPRFTARSMLSLKDQLSELGMPVAFTNAADFTLMTRQERLRISDVFHQGWIAVDEKGTEAAAATVAVMRDTSGPLDPLTMNLDRPFAFVIHDYELAVPVLAGWVADPTAQP